MHRQRRNEPNSRLIGYNRYDHEVPAPNNGWSDLARKSGYDDRIASVNASTLTRPVRTFFATATVPQRWPHPILTDAVVPRQTALREFAFGLV